MQYVPLATVLAYIDRTTNRGVPVRVALTRASRRYQLDRQLLVSAYRAVQ